MAFNHCMIDLGANAVDPTMTKEAGTQMLLNHRVYPIQGLALSALFKYAAGGSLLAKIADHFPNGLNTFAVRCRAGVGAGVPALGRRGEIVQGAVVIGFGGIGANLVIAVGFINQQSVGSLHDTFFNALQLVTSPG